MAYEMNINYLDALSDPANPEESHPFKAQRFLCSQAIMLALRGVPGIYFHSLFGSQNWNEGVEITGRNRTINREKLDLDRLENELAETGSIRQLVFSGYLRMLAVRQGNSAFHPNGGQKVLDPHPAIFAILRTSPDGQNRVLCLHNVSSTSVEITDLQFAADGEITDLISGERLEFGDSGLNIEVAPYQILWLRAA